MLFHRLFFFFVFLISLCCCQRYTLADPFPVLPELQTYYSIGQAGSRYLSVAAGISIFLNSVEEQGADQYLQLLKVHVPQSASGVTTKLGKREMYSDGEGVEIGLQNRWELDNGIRTASLSFRHIEWHEEKIDDESEVVSADIIHMAWSAGKPILVAFVGFDLVDLRFTEKNELEVQFLIGIQLAL